jgi:putative serine protease PepD
VDESAILPMDSGHHPQWHERGCRPAPRHEEAPVSRPDPAGHLSCRPPGGRRSRGAAAGLLVGALVLSGCTGGGNAGPAPSSAAAGSAAAGTPALDEQAAYERVIKKVLPAVVEIRSTSGLGSGVVFDSMGDIATNAHVVGTEKQFEVLSAASATSMKASLVGSYPPNDLAVIRLSGGQKLQPATFADSSKAQVGEIVLAMGNPLGLSATVTNGIVSATGRTVTEPASPGSPGATLPDMLQTSAPINPGNSGGALVDMSGQVLGIPTLAAVNGEQGGAAPGIGFAIPANQVRRIAGQLAATGTVTNSGRAALGVHVTTVADQAGQPLGVGVVSVTPGGPAARAGIRPGDIIVAIDGTPTPTAQALGAALAELRPGQKVSVTIERGGTKRQLQVTLGQL